MNYQWPCAQTDEKFWMTLQFRLNYDIECECIYLFLHYHYLSYKYAVHQTEGREEPSEADKITRHWVSEHE